MVESADGNTLYVAAYEFFVSIDVSDKDNPIQNDSVGTGGLYSWDIVLSSDEQTAFLASGSYVKIYDIRSFASRFDYRFCFKWRQ